MEGLSIRECISSAIRYWEPRRVLYNIVLAAVVGIYFWTGWPDSKHVLTADSILVLFLMAVLANVPYCAAYLVDVFAADLRFSRGVELVALDRFTIGTAFAAVLTRFFAFGMFGRHRSFAWHPPTYSQPLVLAILAASTRLLAPNLLIASER
jgi:hypothetical protein